MIFHLFFELKEYFTPLNVFRYVSFRIMVAFITALFVSLALFPWFIRQLQGRQIGQVVSEALGEAHQAKNNTPTMGGLLIIVAMLISTLMWSDLTNSLVWLAVGVTAALSIVGFVDDVMKLGVRGSKGLSEKGKLVGQFSIAGFALVLLLFVVTPSFSTEITIPFVSVDKFTLNVPRWIYVIFGSFVIVGASNALNLTDGLDGLAIGPVIAGAGTWTLLAYLSATTLSVPVVVGDVSTIATFDIAEYLMIPSVQGAQELSIFASAMAGASVGFLWYNAKPASVFMGDVGALGLGGALGVLAVLTKNEVLCVLVMAVPVGETLSVIIQRYSLRLRGKRVFLMSPIHHHFEQKNWSETKIVVRFWIVAFLFCLLALASLKLR